MRRILRPWRGGPERSASRDRTPPYLRIRAHAPSPFEWSVPPALLTWGAVPIESVHDLSLAATTMSNADLRALPWTATYDDPEDAASLHRFAWLQQWLLARSQEGADVTTIAGIVGEAMRSWMAAAGEPGSAAAPWQPYSVAERIVNWTISALAIGHRLTDDEDVRASVVQQLAYLAKNLEYHGEALTGNHLSNDGRGLYIGGIFVNDLAAVDLGRTILLEERKRLFEEPWFAREGSSHYQFLIARNYMETLWFAERAGDGDLIASIAPTVARLVAGCRFLLVAESGTGERMPLIGDISPDCVGSSRVDLQACKLEYSIVSPK